MRTFLVAAAALLLFAGCSSSRLPVPPPAGDGNSTNTINIWPSAYPTGDGGSSRCPAPLPPEGARVQLAPSFPPARPQDPCADAGGLCQVEPELRTVSFAGLQAGRHAKAPRSAVGTSGPGGWVIVALLGGLALLGLLVIPKRRDVGALLLISTAILASGCASVSGLASRDDLDQVVEQERLVDVAKADAFNEAIAAGEDPAAATAKAFGAHAGVRTPLSEGIAWDELLLGLAGTALTTLTGVNILRNRSRKKALAQVTNGAGPGL